MGPLEILLIVAVIALLFGAKKLPEIMKGMGQGIKEFKKEVHEPVQPHTQVVVDVPSQQLGPVATTTVSAQPVQTVTVAHEPAVQVPTTERR